MALNGSEWGDLPTGDPRLGRENGRIPFPDAMAVVWATTAVTLLFVLIRLGINLKFTRRLHCDDWLAVIAFLLLLTDSILFTRMSSTLYEVLRYRQGLMPDPEAGFWIRAEFYLKCQFASTLVFWTQLWTVKACFLAFFWRLTNQVVNFRRLWWLVMVICFLSYVGCIITYPIACSSFKPGVCAGSDKIRVALISLRYSTAMDIVTDVLIMAIPLCLTWRLQMSTRQKISLYAVFGLAIITCIFAVVRIIVSIPGFPTDPELSWFATFSAVEMAVALIVASLTSFRVLFTQITKSPSGGALEPTPLDDGPDDQSSKGSQAGFNKTSTNATSARKKSWTSKSIFTSATDSEDQEMRDYGAPPDLPGNAASDDHGASRDWTDPSRNAPASPSPTERQPTYGSLFPTVQQPALPPGHAYRNESNPYRQTHHTA